MQIWSIKKIDKQKTTPISDYQINKKKTSSRFTEITLVLIYSATVYRGTYCGQDERWRAVEEDWAGKGGWTVSGKISLRTDLNWLSWEKRDRERVEVTFFIWEDLRSTEWLTLFPPKQKHTGQKNRAGFNEYWSVINLTNERRCPLHNNGIWTINCINIIVITNTYFCKVLIGITKSR